MIAQDTNQNVRKLNRFYIGPADLFFNTLQLGYERNLRNHNSIALSAGFKMYKEDEVFHRIGVNGELQYRVNLDYNRESIYSINSRYSTFAYFAPYLNYRYEEMKDKNTNDNNYTSTYCNSVSGGFGFGFRLSALESRLCLNAFAGGGLKYSEVLGLDRYKDFLEVGYTGIAPRLAIQIGISF